LLYVLYINITFMPLCDNYVIYLTFVKVSVICISALVHLVIFIIFFVLRKGTIGDDGECVNCPLDLIDEMCKWCSVNCPLGLIDEMCK